MKTNHPKFFITTAFCLLSLSGCSPQTPAAIGEGANVTADFLSTNSGTYNEPKQGGVLAVNSNGAFRKVGTFQVGTKDDTEVPYPTTCRYAQSGTIERVYLRNETRRREHLEYATHLFLSAIHKVELEGDSKALVNCQNFEKRKSAQLPFYDVTYSEVISVNHLRLHESGGADSEQGSARPASTLDENYYREGSTELATANNEVNASAPTKDQIKPDSNSESSQDSAQDHTETPGGHASGHSVTEDSKPALSCSSLLI